MIVSTLLLAFVLFVVGQAMVPPAPQPAGHGKAQAMALKADAGSRGAFYGDEIVVGRDASGQFHLPARINGEDTEFLVDTGADVVALTVADAERLGLNVAPDDFRPIMRTASGTGYGAQVTLDRLELGDQEFTDVGAIVVDGLEVNLLGQSVLRRLGSVELRGDRMVIRHR